MLQNGWEAPTTAEPPTWDEPPAKADAVAAEPWPPSSSASAPIPAEAEPEPTPAVVEEIVVEVLEVAPPSTKDTVEVPAAVPAPASAPAPVHTHTHIVQAPAAPSPKLGKAQAAVHAHRLGRYKIPDQPVTMPFGVGGGGVVEKVGMTFGSLSLDGSTYVLFFTPLYEGKC